MLTNNNEVLQHAPAQKYLIENFYPIYLKIEENPKIEEVIKLNQEIIQILSNYAEKDVYNPSKKIVQEFLKKISNNPSDKDLQSWLPVLACELFQAELIDFKETIVEIENPKSVTRSTGSNVTKRKAKRRKR